MAIADDVLVLSGRGPGHAGPSFDCAFGPLDWAGLRTMRPWKNLIDADVVGRRPDGLQVELDADGLRLLAPEVESSPGERVTISIRASDIPGGAGRPLSHQRSKHRAGRGRRNTPAWPPGSPLRERGSADDGRDHPRRAAIAWTVRGRPRLPHNQEHEHRCPRAGKAVRLGSTAGAPEGDWRCHMRRAAWVYQTSPLA